MEEALQWAILDVVCFMDEAREAIGIMPVMILIGAAIWLNKSKNRR